MVFTFANGSTFIETDKLEAIRTWLNAPDPSINFNNALDKKATGTGEWIIKHPTYRGWKNHGNLLWIQGKGTF